MSLFLKLLLFTFGSQVNPTTNCFDVSLFEIKNEHIVIFHSETFVLKSLKGNILSEAGKWPIGVKPLLQVIPLKTSGIKNFEVEEDGSFDFGDTLVVGKYCFKVTVLGWQPVIGYFEISNEAPESGSMNLVMNLGV